MATAITDDATRLTASPEPMPTDVAAPKASLNTTPEEIKTMIAKGLAERTDKPTLEHYYPQDVQLYQVDKLWALARVNREWSLVCESLRSQHLTLRTSTVKEVAASCGNEAVKSLSIHLDKANVDSVAALSHVLAACPNIDRLSLNLIPVAHPVAHPGVAPQQMAWTIGDWMDSRTFQCLRIFFNNELLLAQVLHGQVTTLVLDLATQPDSYNRANPGRAFLSLPACQALARVRGVQDFTADCAIPSKYLKEPDLTKNWSLVKIASLPPDGCATMSANFVPLLQLHAKTIESLRIEDELDFGELELKAPIPQNSLVFPRLNKLELVVTVPSMSFEPLESRCSTFLDLLHPTTPVEFLRYHLNVDSMASLCDFIKSQNPPRLRRVEACVRVRAKWYLGLLPEEEQSAALRSLCEAKGIELDDVNYVEYTR